MSLLFVPFSSAFSISFWHELCKLKLDVHKLSEDPIPLHAQYPLAKQNPTVDMDYQAFQTNATCGPFQYKMTGTLVNANTLPSFKNMKKAEIFAQEAEKVSFDFHIVLVLLELTNLTIIMMFLDLE